jgi:nucleotide-binding universal stress UspA family protein
MRGASGWWGWQPAEMAKRKILIGYDGTPEGEDALGLGRLLCEALKATPVVTTVIRHPRHGASESEFDAAVTEFSQEVFATARERLKGMEMVEQPLVSNSRPEAIYEVTDWEKPDLIVIGSTRQGPTGRIVVGTLGGALLSGVHTGVAVAPRGYASGGPSLDRIGVAVDGGSESWRALSAAAALAERAKGPLQVLSVMEEPHYVLGGLLSPLNKEEYREYKEHEWEGVQEEAARRVPGVSTEPKLLHGDPPEALAAAAQQLDLLAVGSRAYGPVKGALLGSVSSKLMATARCPVLVLPRGASAHPLEA